MAKKAAKAKKNPGKAAKATVSPIANPTMRDVIIKAIEETGQSVRSIALNAGIDQSQLFRFVVGERDLRLEAADKVARSLGLKLVKVESTA